MNVGVATVVGSMTDQQRGRVTRRSVLGTMAFGTIGLAGCQASGNSDEDVCEGFKDKLEYDGTIKLVDIGFHAKPGPILAVGVVTEPSDSSATMDLFVGDTPRSKNVPPSESEVETVFDLSCEQKSAWDGCVGADGGEYTVQVRQGDEVIDRQTFNARWRDSDCFEVRDVTEGDNGQ